MRVTILTLTLIATAGIAGCGKKEAASDGRVAATEPSSAPASAAVASPPKRKAGLWEQTMTADGGKAMVMRMCTDEAFEAKASWVANNAMPGACSQAVTPTPGGGWSFTSTCDMGSGGKTVSEGTATGDFGAKYEVKAKSTTTGAQVPQMNRSSEMNLVAVYKGACPEGWAAGDVEMPGMGKISTAGMMANMGDRVAKAAPSK